jgi:hypothetical protein
MNGWMDVSLDFIHVDEKYAFFLKKYFIYISQMRTTEEEGVWKGHSSAFFSSPSSLLFFSAFQRFPSFSRKSEMEPPLMTYHEAEMQRSHHFIQALKV